MEMQAKITSRAPSWRGKTVSMTYDEAVKKLVYQDEFGPVLVARELGVTSQAVNGWFQDGKKVPAGRDMELASIFGVDPAALRLGRIEPLKAPTLPTERRINVDAKFIRDFMNEAANSQLIGLWIGMDPDTRANALEIVKAVVRVAARGSAKIDDFTHDNSP